MPPVEGFHAHVYFTEATRDSAERLAHDLRQALGQHVRVSSLREQPIGPHPLPMFEVVMPRSALGETVAWLMLNHGQHSVLIHPLTGNDLADHTRHPLWLGVRLPLKLEGLIPH